MSSNTPSETPKSGSWTDKERSAAAAVLFLTDITGIQAAENKLWEIATGALRAGIVVSPCTTLATHKDMAFRAQASKAAAFVGDTETITKFLRKDPWAA
ncbi:hypothetical protein HYQ45_018849 [Verticillium longisporum]|uniref:Uncharacterized protein n=1 Tax=Verticillium longisporum TaxID=100787 RepID=A0A8I2ZU60_VERLO|nr:hypothetical protein HYQ45_018849 [Verticillium longisporum]